MVLQLLIDSMAAPQIEINSCKVPIKTVERDFSRHLDVAIKLLEKSSKESFNSKISIIKGIKDIASGNFIDDVYTISIIYLSQLNYYKMKELIRLADLNTGMKFTKELNKNNNFIFLLDNTCTAEDRENTIKNLYFTKQPQKSLEFIFDKNYNKKYDLAINMSDINLDGKNIIKPELVILNYF